MEKIKEKISEIIWKNVNTYPKGISKFMTGLLADQILELLKSEKEKWLEKIEEIIDDNNDLLRWQKEELKKEIKEEL